MKLKKIVSVVLAAICLASLSCVNIVTVFANSAQTYWEGVEQSGAIITEGDSPIVVEKELLTFTPKPLNVPAIVLLS